MAKKETIKHLTDLMATVQMAHHKGHDLGVIAHENPQADSVAISIDLYHFEGDGLPVCEGLTFDQPGKEGKRRAFCVCYDPNDENDPLWILCRDNDGGIDDDTDMLPEYLPEEVLTAIATWLENAMKPNNHIAEENEMVNEKNDVTSFFFYMWNKWSEDECKLVWKDDFYPHFWTKWCYLCEKYGRFGAVEEFYAELSNGNRDKLVKRATEVYNGISEK